MTDTPKDLKGLIETTGQSVIQRMREVVCPKGKKGSWMKNLSDKRLAEVYHRLRMRQSPLSIAKLAQSEWGVMRASDPVSIARPIYKFRDSMLSAELLAFPNEPGTERQEKNAMTRQAALKLLGKPGERVVKKMDLIETMQWVMNEQVERIAECRLLELSSGKTLRMTDGAIASFRKSFIVLSQVFFKLGLWDAKPSEYTLNLKHAVDGVFSKVLQNDGAPMLEAANNFRQIVSKECLELTFSEEEESWSLQDEEGAVVDAGTLQADTEEEGS